MPEGEPISPEPNFVDLSSGLYDAEKDKDPLPTKAEKISYLKDQISWFHAADFRSEVKENYREAKITSEELKAAEDKYQKETDKLSELEVKLPDGYDLKELKTKDEMYRKLIDLSENFDELYDAIKAIELIVGSTGTNYGPKDIIASMDPLKGKSVSDPEVQKMVFSITNVYGIRNKFISLLESGSKAPEPEVKPVAPQEEPIKPETPPQPAAPIDIGEIPLIKDTTPATPPAPAPQGGIFQRVGQRLDAATGKVQDKINEKVEDAKVWGTEFKDSVNAKFETLKNLSKPKLGWLKERTQGFLFGFGWWEVHQAEKLRSGANEAGSQAEAQSQLVQETQNLSVESAHDEANQITANLGRAGFKDATSKDIEQFSRQVTLEKQTANKQIIETIVASAMAKTKEKLTGSFENYTTARTGEDVVNSEEKMKKLEQDIRARLTDMADGQIRQDGVRFSEIIKNDLDPNWKERYIYAGIDLALLSGLGIIATHPQWLFGKAVDSATASAKLISGKAGAGAGKSAEAINNLNQPINKNIWTTLKKIAQAHHKTATNSDLMKWSKEILQNNNMFEKEWLDTAGKISSRKLPVTQLLKLTPTVAKAVGLIP